MGTDGKPNWKVIIVTSVVAPIIVAVSVLFIKMALEDESESFDAEGCHQRYEGWNEHACGVLTSLKLRWGVKVDGDCVSAEEGITGDAGLVLHRPVVAAKLGALVYEPHQVELWYDRTEGLAEIDLKGSESVTSACEKVAQVLGSANRVGTKCRWEKATNDGKNVVVTVAKGKNNPSVVRACLKRENCR